MNTPHATRRTVAIRGTLSYSQRSCNIHPDEIHLPDSAHPPAGGCRRWNHSHPWSSKPVRLLTVSVNHFTKSPSWVNPRTPSTKSFNPWNAFVFHSFFRFYFSRSLLKTSSQTRAWRIISNARNTWEGGPMTDMGLTVMYFLGCPCVAPRTISTVAKPIRDWRGTMTLDTKNPERGTGIWG